MHHTQSVKKTYYVPPETSERFEKVCGDNLSVGATAAMQVFLALPAELREMAIINSRELPPAEAVKKLEAAMDEAVRARLLNKQFDNLPPKEQAKLIKPGQKRPGGR